MSQKRKASASPRIDSEESISRYFKPITPPSVKRRRLTERQKEAILENREKLGALLDTDSTNNQDSIAVVEKKVAAGFYVGNDDTQNENAMGSPPVKERSPAKSPSPGMPTDFSALSRSAEKVRPDEKDKASKSTPRSRSSSPSRSRPSSQTNGVLGNIFDDAKTKSQPKVLRSLDTTPVASPSAESKAALTLKKIEERKKELQREKAATEKETVSTDDRRKSTPKKLVNTKVSTPKSDIKKAKEAETTPKSKDAKKAKETASTPKPSKPTDSGKVTPTSTPNKEVHNETPRSTKSSAKRHSRVTRASTTPNRLADEETPKASKKSANNDDDLTPKAKSTRTTRTEKAKTAEESKKKIIEERKKKSADITPTTLVVELSDDDATPKAVPQITVESPEEDYSRLRRRSQPVADPFASPSPDSEVVVTKVVEKNAPDAIPNTPPDAVEKVAETAAEPMDVTPADAVIEPSVPTVEKETIQPTEAPTKTSTENPSQRQRTPSPLPSILKKTSTPSPSRNSKHVRFDTGKPAEDEEFAKQKDADVAAAPASPPEAEGPMCPDLVNCKDIIRPIVIIELAAKGQFLQLKKAMDSKRIQTIGDLAKQPRSLLEGLTQLKDVDGVIAFLNKYNDEQKAKNSTATSTLISSTKATEVVATRTAVSTTVEKSTATSSISSIAAATQMIAAVVAKTNTTGPKPAEVAKPTSSEPPASTTTSAVQSVEIKTEEIIVDNVITVEKSVETTEPMECDISTQSQIMPNMEELVCKITDAVAEKLNWSELLEKFGKSEESKIAPLTDKIEELNQNYAKFEKNIDDVKRIVVKMVEPKQEVPQEEESVVTVLANLKATMGSRLKTTEECRRASTLLIGLLNDVDTYSRSL